MPRKPVDPDHEFPYGANLPVVARPLDPSLQQKDIWTSVDISTWDGKAAVLYAITTTDRQCEDSDGETFDIKHVVCSPDEIEDRRTGETTRVVRTTLIDPEGNTMGTCSYWFWKALGQAMAMFGKPPYDPPLKIMILKKVASRSGQEFLTLKVLPKEAK